MRPAGTPTEAIDIRDQLIAQAEDDSLTLEATHAEIDGEEVRLEGTEQKYLAWWSHRGKAIKWPVKFEKPGIYEVTRDLRPSGHRLRRGEGSLDAATAAEKLRAAAKREG